MNPLILPAAKLGLSLAGSLVDGVASALDPAKAKAKKQADDFETVFLEQMTERMAATSEGDGPLGNNGTGSDIYRSQLTQEYAKQIQRSGGIGLSGLVMRDLLAVQEKAGGSVAAVTVKTGAGNAG